MLFSDFVCVQGCLCFFVYLFRVGLCVEYRFAVSYGYGYSLILSIQSKLSGFSFGVYVGLKELFKTLLKLFPSGSRYW